MLRLELGHYLLGCLARIPRIAAAYALVRLGGPVVRRLLLGG